MASTNTKTKRSHVYADEQLAGGFGPQAAKQDNESALRRLVMTCLLWEDIAYLDGKSVVEQICALVPTVPADRVAAIAIEARFQQRLRHVPLLLCREMARHASHRGLVADTLSRIIFRADELAEFVALYWKGNGGKKTLSAQVKRGLAAAFTKFDAYQLSKWDRPGRDVSLRDVLFLSHAKPKDQEQESLWKQLVDRTLVPANTWEVGLSAARSADEKRDVWQRLITDGKLGALAFLKNLRNMTEAKVRRATIAAGFDSLKPAMLLPIDFLRAAKYAPEWVREIESAMLKCAGQFPRLGGWTVFVVDVSGSMGTRLSDRSEFTRIDAAASLAVLAAEMCEHISVYATAGCDMTRRHETEKIPSMRGFSLSEKIVQSAARLGGGGIFTRQCLDYIRSRESETPDRIVIFSDSQDCDIRGSGQPKPFGRHNYIVDVSNHQHGVNYAGIWTAEVSGWSEHFLRFIAAVEAGGNN